MQHVTSQGLLPVALPRRHNTGSINTATTDSLASSEAAHGSPALVAVVAEGALQALHGVEGAVELVDGAPRQGHVVARVAVGLDGGKGAAAPADGGHAGPGGQDVGGGGEHLL